MFQSKDRVVEWINKIRPILPTRDSFLIERHTRTESKGMGKIFYANVNENKAGEAILISDKIDFKTKAVTRNKEGHFIMIKELIQREAITLVNIYAVNTGVPKYIKQLLTDIKGEIDNNTVIVGGFYTSLT
uniref:Uncharacterized protein n=1 Tax=Rousettus aegyptiacus TaxID=9407 RepID=A0A7J8FJ75_ROUAE|nr:hypothetical protein HJG63_011938 [Rousettus aegyptiacus]